MKQSKLLNLFFVICVIVVFSLFSNVTTSSAKSEERVELVFAHHIPAKTKTSIAFDQFAVNVEKASGGRIKIKHFPGASLVKSGQNFQAVTGNLCDIGMTAINSYPDIWPLNQVFVQPGVKIPSGKNSISYFKEVYKAVPELAKETSDIKILTIWKHSPETPIHTSKRQIRVPKDMVGLKIIAIGKFVEFVEAAGGTPIGLYPGDHYMAIERGTADGSMTGFSVMDSLGYTELMKYHLNLDLASPPFMMMMNIDKWNSLSPSDQKLIQKEADKAAEIALALTEEENAKILAKIKALNQTVHEPTPEEMVLWQEATQPLISDWMKKNQDKGNLPQKAIEEAQRIANQYKE